MESNQQLDRISGTLIAQMRAAAILGRGCSPRALRPFQEIAGTEWTVGLPAETEPHDAVLVFGGDGTVHRHLSALVRLGCPVLVVPAGSGNDFARALGLYRAEDSLAAWRKFLAGSVNVRTVDLGVITPLGQIATTAAKAAPAESHETARLKARPDTHQARDEGAQIMNMSEPLRPSQGRSAPSAQGGDTPTLSPSLDVKPISSSRASSHVYFSCAAGVGLDGEISRRANELPRWLRGHGGYALTLPVALARFRPFALTLTVARDQGGGEEIRQSERPMVAAVFANTPVYGGGMRIAPRAHMDDGLLDACVIGNISKLKLLGVFPSVYFGRHLGIREVEYFPVAAARVDTDRPLDIYADGERICQTPIKLSVAPQALRVIVP